MTPINTLIQTLIWENSKACIFRLRSGRFRIWYKDYNEWSPVYSKKICKGILLSANLATTKEI
jgi:hypothetical protein